LDDFSAKEIGNVWTDTGTGSFTDDKLYVVQTGTKTVQRCILMSTDPGDLVLDPTCGSGTTAYVAEQWGRRWITIDTSRAALALARARIMGARYPWYILADSPEGQRKEAEVTRGVPATTPTHAAAPGLRLQASVARYAWLHCQQCRDRHDLGRLSNPPGTPARSAQRRAGHGVEEWEIPRLRKRPGGKRLMWKSSGRSGTVPILIVNRG
jgi:adenine-specific DNA-methyltransferase